MRPNTAETSQISFPATLRWKQRSSSPKSSISYAERQVRNLMLTSNVNAFIDGSSIKIESASLNTSVLSSQKEIYEQLTYIKSRFNLTRKRFSMGDSQLKELERISIEKAVEQRRGNTRILQLNDKISNIWQIIEGIKKKQEEAEQDLLVYGHVYERTKISQIFLDMKKNYLKNEIRQKNIFMESEQRLKFKARGSRTCSQRTYHLLYNSVTSETKDKQSILQKISRDLELREFLHSKREERKKRYIEISEIAANEHRDRHENDLREGLLLNRFAAKFLSSKLAYETQKYSNIEMAFQKIRSVTGEHDVIELVHKFLTSEETFKELKNTIEFSRVSIIEMNKKNGEIEKFIKVMAIFDKESRHSDIFELKEKLSFAAKEVETIKSKFQNCTAIFQHILQWNERMIGLFNEKLPEKLNINERFKVLSRVIVEKIREMKKKKLILQNNQ